MGECLLELSFLEIPGREGQFIAGCMRAPHTYDARGRDEAQPGYFPGVTEAKRGTSTDLLDLPRVQCCRSIKGASARIVDEVYEPSASTTSESSSRRIIARPRL